MEKVMSPAFIIHEVSGFHEVPEGHPERLIATGRLFRRWVMNCALDTS